MSYKDLKEPRVKRAEKEATKEAKYKGKRGWKCKSTMLEEATVDKAKRGRMRKRAGLEAEALEPKVKVAPISKRQSQ